MRSLALFIHLNGSTDPLNTKQMLLPANLSAGTDDCTINVKYRICLAGSYIRFAVWKKYGITAVTRSSGMNIFTDTAGHDRHIIRRLFCGCGCCKCRLRPIHMWPVWQKYTHQYTHRPLMNCYKLVQLLRSTGKFQRNLNYSLPLRL